MLLFKIFKKFAGALRFKLGTHVPLPKIINFMKKYLGIINSNKCAGKVHFKIKFYITQTRHLGVFPFPKLLL